MAQGDSNAVDAYDEVIQQIINYAYDFDISSPIAWVRAKATLLDALGVAFESLETSDSCARLIGPTFPGTGVLVDGFRLPGTTYQLDIMKGAFDLGTMIRYLDHNDAFPGAEWGHPSGECFCLGDKYRYFKLLKTYRQYRRHSSHSRHLHPRRKNVWLWTDFDNEASADRSDQGL